MGPTGPGLSCSHYLAGLISHSLHVQVSRDNILELVQQLGPEAAQHWHMHSTRTTGTLAVLESGHLPPRRFPSSMCAGTPSRQDGMRSCPIGTSTNSTNTYRVPYLLSIIRDSAIV
ncbi:hypothetical protein V8C34DRAFT_272332 [Trichoderma compactum]